MNNQTYEFMEALGIAQDLDEYFKNNPEVSSDPAFKEELLVQVAMLMEQRFSSKEMQVISDFHLSDEGQSWLNKNSQMADEIDKLFKAHALSKLSQQLFTELNLLPIGKDDEETIN